MTTRAMPGPKGTRTSVAALPGSTTDRFAGRCLHWPGAWLVALVSIAGLTIPLRAASQESPPEAVDASDVGVDVETLADRVYLLRIRDEGGGWVNALALASEEGGLLVDHAGDWRTLEVGQDVIEAVREALLGIGVDSVRYLVNTHWHGDHSAGNPWYSDATIVSHARVRDRLASRQTPWWYPDGIGPMETSGLPDLVFERALTLSMGAERVHLWHFGPAHTDGDAVVYLESARVAHMGDLYHGADQPSVGEDIKGLARALEAAASRMHPDTRIVTGHGGLTSVQEMLTYHAMLIATIAHVERQLAAGADLPSIQDRGLPTEWEGTIPSPDAVRTWLQEIHRSLTGS